MKHTDRLPIEVRVTHLERQLRVWKAVVLLGASGMLFSSAFRGVEPVRAESFVVVDASGAQRARFGMLDPTGCGLEFLDSDGARASSWLVDPEFSGISMQPTKNGANRILMATSKYGPSIALADAAGTRKLQISVVGDSPAIIVGSPAGLNAGLTERAIGLYAADKPRFLAEHDPAKIKMQLMDAGGAPRWVGLLDEKLGPSLSMGTTSSARLMLGVAGEEGGLLFLDGEGAVVWKEP